MSGRSLDRLGLLLVGVIGLAFMFLTPRLADFGLARDEAEVDLALTGSGIAVGTPRYSSPEQSAGASRSVDGRADIYSLGLVLASMIVRRPPEAPRVCCGS